MYFQKFPELFQEFVEFIRIAKKFFEKIFVIEVKIFGLSEKSIFAKNIYEGKEDAKPYYIGMEISKILKLYLSLPKLLNLFLKLENYSIKGKLISLLNYILNSRNSIAHNKVKNINKEIFLSQVEFFQEVLKRSETIYSLHVPKTFYSFLSKLVVLIKEKIGLVENTLGV
jgi:hypothetical protein